MIGQKLDPEALSRDPGLRGSLLALNNRSALETSWLEPARFDGLVASAFAAFHVPEAQALLLTFDQHADYDSPNFLWFRNRLARFVYVDRIVVDAQARGRGLARQLYEQLFTFARKGGHTIVTCEVNAVPPNPGSDAFHAAMGFEQAGTATLAPGKTVRYLSKRLA